MTDVGEITAVHTGQKGTEKVSLVRIILLGFVCFIVAFVIAAVLLSKTMNQDKAASATRSQLVTQALPYLDGHDSAKLEPIATQLRMQKNYTSDIDSMYVLVISDLLLSDKGHGYSDLHTLQALAKAGKKPSPNVETVVVARPLSILAQNIDFMEKLTYNQVGGQGDKR